MQLLTTLSSHYLVNMVMRRYMLLYKITVIIYQPNSIYLYSHYYSTCFGFNWNLLVNNKDIIYEGLEWIDRAGWWWFRPLMVRIYKSELMHDFYLLHREVVPGKYHYTLKDWRYICIHILPKIKSELLARKSNAGLFIILTLNFGRGKACKWIFLRNNGC